MFSSLNSFLRNSCGDTQYQSFYLISNWWAFSPLPSAVVVVVNKMGVRVGAGWCRRVRLWLVREGDERGGSGTPELNFWAFQRCCGLHSKTHILCGRYGNINEMPVLTKVGHWELILDLNLFPIYTNIGFVEKQKTDAGVCDDKGIECAKGGLTRQSIYYSIV